ncbi:MAG TPA: PQQ-dependent sugar dehydrogenase [Rhizomicrobium sp.]|nr:PQQ-dependent sugar dehydrogenase [Rhizomicrobium sp.]
MKYLLLAALLALTLPTAAQDAAPKGPATLPPPRPYGAPRLVEGLPFETVPPEKADDHPLFAHQTRAPVHKTAPYQVTTITDKLHLPWSLAFLPDGKFLVSEKYPGQLRIVAPDGTLSAPLGGLSVLAGKLGLLDVVLAPDFKKSKRIYFAFFENLGPAYSNTCLAYGLLDQAGNAVHDVTVIYRGVPQIPARNFNSKQGGRIAFAPDGSLFMTVGDRDDNIKADYDAALAQKTDNDVGKIIHLTPEGLPAADNPRLPGWRPELWAIGIRSPEGLVFAPDGTLWETEHGPRGGDEVNIIKRGKNYGWPIITHGIDYLGGQIGAGIVAKAGLEQPVYYWDPVIAPSGLAWYDGTLFAQWRGSLLAGALIELGVYRLKIAGHKVVAEEPLLTELKTRIRDVRVGPDGAVYVLTEQHALLKLTPK